MELAWELSVRSSALMVPSAPSAPVRKARPEARPAREKLMPAALEEWVPPVLEEWVPLALQQARVAG
jgi:hypothetical protein